MKHQTAITLFLMLFSFSLFAQVTMKKEEDGLLFQEKGENIFFYQMEPKDDDGAYRRNHYIHPLWGMNGAVLTEDFPADHLHHRGIFWAWHQVWIGDKRIGDPWVIEDFDQEITEVEFLAREPGKGILNTEVLWKSDQWKKGGNKIPYLQEKTKITVHPRSGNFRQIDFEMSLLALVNNLSIGGSEDEKGYSGFSVRMVLPDDVGFSGPKGQVQPEVTAVQSEGYINISGSIGRDGKNAGIVMVDNPENPGYPQPWILRAKRSMQNAVFPGRNTISVSTTDPLVLKYSLIVYSGKLGNSKIQSIIKKINF